MVVDAAIDEVSNAASNAATAAAPPSRKLLLGLIGAGIARSLTPAMHEEEARHHGIKLHYQLIDIERDARGAAALPMLLDAARTMGFAGLNITYPCKQVVMALLDDLSPEARAIGAVNTVVINGERLIGHNTDASGWASGFTRALPQADLSRVVLLGAGGAGAAIAHAALRLGVAELRIHDRDPAKATELAAELAGAYGPGRANAQHDVTTALRGATGLIHATPTGMDKLPGLPLPEHLVQPTLWVSEIVYFPLDTALVRLARARGCAVSDGSGMAVGQAVGAFERFTGRTPDAGRMQAHLKRLLQASVASALKAKNQT